eukprot:CAMPEP_0198343176 /NCGR_PEP_ID=MMETSP1450-20131203/58447_1 /TAXON_ID=753684 ORGANISM="Madagascaria erythrocladiodes, Strain CCMP3234" /NCGR_SAMPLE_ID=MMETSP1450 /ASSEMBLY_ACC=CAM_ASM_001115 /LENGTH=76 /DNA_ID=CAMNT_0044048331 /DNA_START=19 /DNA_END=246 /DNA_ORIENTATION=-
MTGKVLVTGASGFIASHCIIQLLEAGYSVKGTVRNVSRTAVLRKIFHKNATFDDSCLEFCKADLSKDDGWKDTLAD